MHRITTESLWETPFSEKPRFLPEQAYLTSKTPQHELNPVIGLTFPLHGSQLCTGFSQYSRLPSTLFEFALRSILSGVGRYGRPEVRNVMSSQIWAWARLSPQGKLPRGYLPRKNNISQHNWPHIFFLVQTLFRPYKWFTAKSWTFYHLYGVCRFRHSMIIENYFSKTVLLRSIGGKVMNYLYRKCKQNEGRQRSFHEASGNWRTMIS